MPDESPIGVPLGEADCPPPPQSPQAAKIKRVVPWPDGGDAPVVLTTSPATASPPAMFRFRLRNDSTETLWTNRYGWALWKRALTGEWAFICPDLVNDALNQLYAGETYEWTMSIEAGGPADGDLLPDPSGAGDLIVSGLGGGTYSFTCHDFFRHDRADSESLRGEPGNEIGFAARFQIDAPPVQLTPADAITERRREGDTLALRTAASPTEYERLAVFIVERVDGRDETSDGATTNAGQSAALDQSEVIVTERVLRERQPRTRRSLLQIGGLTLGGFLTGCAGDDPAETASPTQTTRSASPTETATPTATETTEQFPPPEPTSAAPQDPTSMPT